MPAGLAHLHQRKFYHRDLKLENVAVSEGNIVKLIDLAVISSVPAAGKLRNTAATTEEEIAELYGMSVAEMNYADELRKMSKTVIGLSQKAHTRAPEVVLAQLVKGTREEQEKVRHPHACVVW